MRFPSSARAFVVVLAGCASSASHSTDPVPAVLPTTAPSPAPRPAASNAAAVTPVTEPVDPPARRLTEVVYGDHIHSVRFVRATVLRKAPDAAADKVGIIGKDARARVDATAAAGHGCATRWLAIAPRGWTCETAIEPSPEVATPAVAATLADDGDDDTVSDGLGVYGAVRGRDVPVFTSRADALAGEPARVLTGATSVRARAVTQIDGVRYWVTTGGELIDASSIATISPSKFRGVALDRAAPCFGADGHGQARAVDAHVQLPLAWVHAQRGVRTAAALREAPSPTAELVGELGPRTVVSVGEDSPDHRFVRVSVLGSPDGTGWVARGDLRIAASAAPPPGTADHEKWFDVDLDQQTLVAYEGKTAVYATLVSTGKWDHRTPSAIARVVAKHERANMISEKRELYSVADVPWTMYYDHDFALHTAYWHDGFGDPRSHGCVNLSPRDARRLYHWSSPDVPPGWTTVYGDLDNPGSLVRIRSAQTPAPLFRGYARLRDLRGNVPDPALAL